MQMIFFGQLSLVETQKVVERLINYVLFKVDISERFLRDCEFSSRIVRLCGGNSCF